MTDDDFFEGPALLFRKSLAPKVAALARMADASAIGPNILLSAITAPVVAAAWAIAEGKMTPEQFAEAMKQTALAVAEEEGEAGHA